MTIKRVYEPHLNRFSPSYTASSSLVHSCLPDWDLRERKREKIDKLNRVTMQIQVALDDRSLPVATTKKRSKRSGHFRIPCHRFWINIFQINFYLSSPVITIHRPINDFLIDRNLFLSSINQSIQIDPSSHDIGHSWSSPLQPPIKPIRVINWILITFGGLLAWPSAATDSKQKPTWNGRVYERQLIWEEFTECFISSQFLDCCLILSRKSRFKWGIRRINDLPQGRYARCFRTRHRQTDILIPPATM